MSSYKVLTTAWNTLKSDVKTAIKNCYDACTAKGATIPQSQTLANLASCIGSITAATLNPNPTEIPTLIHFKSGEFNTNSSFLFSSLSITSVGFKPKIFILQSKDTSASNINVASGYNVIEAHIFCDDSYNVIKRGFSWASSSKYANCNSSATAGLIVTSNGVTAEDTRNDRYLYSPNGFKWYAWG